MQLSLTINADNRDEIRRAICLLQELAGDPYDAVLREERAERVAPVVETPPAAEVFTPDPATVFAGNGDAATVTVAAGSTPSQTSGPASAATPVPIAAGPVGTPPAPAPAPVAFAPSGVDLDAKGLPWDMRIHASTKVKNADGSWRAKRGLNDGALVARVEAELRAAMAAPRGGPAVEPVAPPVAAAPSFPGDAAASPVPPVPSLSPVAVPAPPAPPAAALGVTTFPDIMRKISGLLAGATPRLTHPELQEALGSVGLASLPLLASRPDLIPQVDAIIDAVIMSKPVAPVAPLPPGTPVH